MKKGWIFVFILLFVSFSILSWADTKILAIVGNQKITLKEFNRQRHWVEKERQKPLTQEEMRKLLDRMVIRSLLYQEALRKGLDKDQEVLFRLEEARKKILTRALLDKKIASSLHYTDKDLKEYYQTHQKDYTIPELASGQVILIYKFDRNGNDKTNEAKKLALEIKERMKKGENYRDLHKLYLKKTSLSIQPSQFSNLTRTLLERDNPNYAKVVFSLNKGEVGMGETKDRFFVVKVTEKHPPRLKPFKEVKNEVEVVFQNKKGREILKGYIDTLKKATKIETYYENLPEPNI